MKRLLSCALVLFLAWACKADGFTSLTNDEFEQLLATNTVQLLDVRTANEFATRPHIAGAQNIDVRSADFSTLAQEQLDKQVPVAVYCLHGKRSKMAAKILVELGYKVYDLNTGIEAWQNAGKPVE